MAKRAVASVVEKDEESDQPQDDRSELQKKIDWAMGAGFSESQAKFLAVHFGWEE